MKKAVHVVLGRLSTREEIGRWLGVTHNSVTQRIRKRGEVAALAEIPCQYCSRPAVGFDDDQEPNCFVCLELRNAEINLARGAA